MPDFEGSVTNAQSTDNWKELRCPATTRLTISVVPLKGSSTGGILYQLGKGAPAAVFSSTPQPLLPGIHNRERRVDAVRFKSLVAGKPAVVSIETATQQQIGGARVG